MPSNKNALTRYKYLDEMLSDRHHYFTIADLTERVNEKLEDAGLPKVTRRCIEKDIIYLEYDPFFADIERYRANGKNCLRYANPSFSIFQKELSDEERHLLNEVLSTLGQFEGLAHFEWLEKFKIGLGFENRRQIISFSNNPYLRNTNLLGILFDNIANEVVVRLSYHTFSNTDTRSIVFHPYLLKQYNDRWFLLGAADSDKKILTFALDRIDKVEPMPEKKYMPCPDDLYDRFEDIVGVTLYEGHLVEHITCWVSDKSKGYVDSKPIHGSYTMVKGVAEKELRANYLQLQGGMFFSLDCIMNYELVCKLCSFGGELLVLSPYHIISEIQMRLEEMSQQYKMIQLIH